MNNFRKIHIIGGPGSGKTYAAKTLSKMLDIESYDLDNLFWDNTADNYGTRANVDERNKNLSEIIQKESWIVEGVYYAWTQNSFQQAELIAVLDPNPYLCDMRIIKRFIYRKMGILKSKKETFKDLYDLIKWNHHFQKVNLVNIRNILESFANKTKYFSKADDLIQYSIH